MQPDQTQSASQTSQMQESPYILHRRFDRMGRLIGDSNMEKLLRTHVMVIGLGGVGSWAAEALARSGVGKLTLVDYDEVCITNTNRQLHSISGMIGKKKAVVMAERIQKINPQIQIEAMPIFYNKDTSDEVLAKNPDYVFDATDNMTAKCHLLATLKQKKIKTITSGGSAAKMDPTCIKISDLASTEVDPMCVAVRRILRQEYGFPKVSGDFGITCVWSPEKPTMPVDLAYDNGQGFKCVCPQGQNGFNTCDNKNLINGSAAFVTGAFGLAAASWIVRDIISETTSTTTQEPT
jgi:tRNA threonylcarbamoyladenosine dehydratase